MSVMRDRRTLMSRRVAVAVVAAALVSLPVAAQAGSGNGASDAGDVTTDKGVVVGTVADGVRTFLGVPYAAPPTGDRRWASPEPAARWSEPRDATSLGAACQQNANTNFGTLVVPISEDCLFLNVYTPTTGTAGRPVMVWFHGGGYVGGQGGDYDGQFFARDHDAVVVTVNYRLGVFGFLASSALSASSPDETSGNYGIEDQRAALEWVKKNIAAFGGDPKRVTIAGESAGSGSVCVHTMSPESRGLFAAAIMESGTCAARLAPTPKLAEAEAEGDTFASSLGCAGNDTDAAACLREKPAEQVLATVGGDSVTGGATIPLSPIVDGRVLPKEPDVLLKSGKFNRVPVIIGSNSDEGTTFVLINYELEGSPVTADGYGAAIENLMPTADVDDVMRLYPLSDYPSPSQALAAARTDAASCPINSAAKMYAGKVPTYAYVFADRNAPFPLGKLPTLTMGAGHGFEMQYLFQSQGIPLVSTTPTQFDAAQQAVSDSLTGYWAEFMAEQAPEKGGGPAWPTFKAANGKRIVFNSDATIVSAGDFDQEHHCDFWLSQKG
jgi:para-nitrobenzyl esterase